MALILSGLVLATLGLILLFISFAALLKRRPLKCATTCTCASGTLVVAALALGIGINIAGYARLTHERHIASLQFYQIQPQQFNATIQFNQFTDDQQDSQLISQFTSQFTSELSSQLTPKPSFQFELQGDEWQIDARILKWHGYANLIGLDALFSLDRIQGRYSDIDQARSAKPTLVALDSQPGIDLWQLSRRWPWLAHLVDARYGSATYMPMADGAEYHLYVGQSGLLARPANDPAKAAVQRW